MTSSHTCCCGSMQQLLCRFEESPTVEIGAQHLRPLKKSSWSSFPFISPTCSRIQMICFHWKWMIFSCLSCLYTHYFRYLYICWGGRRELIKATWKPSVEWEWRSRSDKSWEFYLEGIMCVYAKKRKRRRACKHLTLNNISLRETIRVNRK